MPYLHCPSCRLATFSAAAYTSRDECPRCGTELAPKPRPLFGPIEPFPPGKPEPGRQVEPDRQAAA